MFLSLLLVLALLCTAGGAVFADEAAADTVRGVPVSAGQVENGYTELTARFYVVTSAEMNNLTVRYSDEYFLRDPDAYYHDLAQASFGMAASAFRTSTDEGAAMDDNIRSFFDQAGFSGFESTWFDRKPTADSIATAIASKNLGGTTVVALICSGAGYGDEWLSNLTVGAETDHEGFSAAAAICRERLEAYLESHAITGDVRLWISGFSRASAVGNFLAAEMMKTDTFSAIYGYFFATPNNTRDPVAYPNLFNIVGQYDPVPQVPLTLWGYGRNGVDLYTPAQETDSTFIQAAVQAEGVAEELAGTSFRNNPDLNRQLRVVFEYLGIIFPTAEDYTEQLQPGLLSVYRQHSGSDLLVVLREALAGVRFLSLERQEAVNALSSYLDKIIYQYVSGNTLQQKDGSWDVDAGLSSNLVLEHMPETYAEWLFSTDDPEGLFSESTDTVRLVIQGDFDLSVWDEYGIIQSISSDNEEEAFIPGGEVRPAEADAVYLYVTNSGGKAVVNLPQDEAYEVRLTLEDDQTVSLFSNSYGYGNTSHGVSSLVVFRGNEGDVFVLNDLDAADGASVSMADGTEVTCLRQTLSSDTESVTVREQMMSGTHSIFEVVVIGSVLSVLPLLCLLAALIIFLAGRRKRRGRLGISICFGVTALAFAAGALWFWFYLPNVGAIPLTLGSLAAVFFLLSIWRRRRWKRKKAAAAGTATGK